MCTFNGSQFLPAQLESIREQARLPDELVICDDGSTDTSYAIALNFARQAPFPVHIIQNESNLGSTKNFEKAISLCRGSIVVLADQDDFWYPSKLNRIEKSFLSSNAPVAVFSDAHLIDNDSRPAGHRLWQSFSFPPAEQRQFANGDALKILTKHPVVTGATMAFRKEFFPLLSPIPANHVHDTWIAYLLAACGPMLPISEPLMQFRQHDNQQIGPGRWTLMDRFRRARETGSQFYLEEIIRFHQLAERLKQRRSDFPHVDRALHQIDQKISHREHRACLPTSGILRIAKVLQEVANGGYWHYSEGWPSVAKDIVIGKRR